MKHDDPNAFEVDANLTIHTRLPAAVSSCQHMEAMHLTQLRNRINSLESQGYGLYLRKVFEDNPLLLAIRIQNSDDENDNGRHISLITEDMDDDDWSRMDEALFDHADYLNNAIRHRGIYDYLDNLIALGMLTRDKIDQQLAQAYDETFEDAGAWVRLRAAAEADALEQGTPTVSASSPRSRM